MKLKLTAVATAILCSHAVVAESKNEMETIEVTGTYLSVNKSNSIKSPTPIIDVPQSLSIITAEELTQRGMTSVSDVIDYTPGVNTSQGEGHRDAIVFRGVRSTADFFIDGNRDDVQYYRSFYNVEQVEILRGPNALLFGRGGTGGILNRVSKKADLSSDFTTYKAALNTFGGYNTEIDLNYVPSDTSAVRINAMYEHLDGHRDFYDGDRYGFNPTARFELMSDTILDVSYEYINHERFIDRGVPTGTDGKPVEAFKDIVFGDPENNYNDLDAHVFRANLEHSFSDNLKGNFNAFYGDYDKVYSNFYASGYDQASTPAQVTLDGYIDTTLRQNLILSSNLVSEFDFGGLGHVVIFGAEYIDTASDQNRFNPVFSSTGNDKEAFTIERPLNFNGFSGVNADGDSITTEFSALNDDTRVELQVTSLYVQDEIEITDQLDVIVGARFDSFDIEVFNAKALETRTRKDEEISPRAGIVYKPQENISVYASYSESFLPRSGEQYANINGDSNRLDPDVFENQEIGVKWDFTTDLSFTAAIFDNKKSSPEYDDNDAERLVVVSSEFSGFELQLSGQVTEEWFVSANYSSLDGDYEETGNKPRELPENTFSVWNAYQVNDKFGLGLGLTYQDESFIDNGNTRVLPSYTRVDASAYYNLSEDLRIQLNLENLTDELYFPNAHSSHQVTVGAPVNAAITVIGKL
ncbi:MAG: TonB-dependent siderophore receptor [Gammaproteobacteria bacterium]|nr:TonB-dependent siderophore receptor [Gammaproteobacteria bacterium]